MIGFFVENSQFAVCLQKQEIPHRVFDEWTGRNSRVLFEIFLKSSEGITSYHKIPFQFRRGTFDLWVRFCNQRLEFRSLFRARKHRSQKVFSRDQQQFESLLK